jgi:uroporphyrinogen decarboxylase
MTTQTPHVGLTCRENFVRMMRRASPAWLPLDLPVTPPIVDELERRTGTRDVVAAFGLDFRGLGSGFVGRGRQAWLDAYAALGVALPPQVEIEAFGIAHVPPPPESVGEAYHFRTMLHPLETIESADAVAQLPWPALDADALVEHMRRQVQRIHAEGRVAMLGMECTVFESSWYLRGMDGLFMDMAEGGEVGQWLLEFFTRRSEVAAAAGAIAGVDVIGLGDDIGTQRGMMMAPDFWRTHLKPRLQRVVAAARRHQHADMFVRYHSDGDVRDVLDDLVEVGIDILNPVQPECMPHDEVIPRYADRLAFWGMIGTQTTMPFGTADDVRDAVRRCTRDAEAGRAIVVAPTHVLEPDVPWTNIEALVSAVKSVRLASVFV